MTIASQLPNAIDDLLDKKYTADKTLNEAVRIVGETLGTDRCFLYVRQPDRNRGRTAFCWRRDDTVPDAIQPDWQPDTTDLPNEDPLIRAGLNGEKSVYVDDVKTAGPGVLNQEFEQKTFGHRALIHAHIQQDGKLWGILQPCLFEQTHHWTDDEKAGMEAILPKLQPAIAEFVS